MINFDHHYENSSNEVHKDLIKKSSKYEEKESKCSCKKRRVNQEKTNNARTNQHIG